MAGEIAKREVLRVIAEHDGQWYWYQVDRAISGLHPDCVGPFQTEILELEGAGLIEVRACPDLPGGVRYWLTEAGRAAVRGQEPA
jgi:hypothetical protein